MTWKSINSTRDHNTYRRNCRTGTAGPGNNDKCFEIAASGIGPRCPVPVDRPARSCLGWWSRHNCFLAELQKWKKNWIGKHWGQNNKMNKKIFDMSNAWMIDRQEAVFVCVRCINVSRSSYKNGKKVESVKLFYFL